MAKLAWFCVAVACGALWVTNIPVPEGFDNPWSFRFIFAALKVINAIGGFQEYFKDPRDVVIGYQVDYDPTPITEDIGIMKEDREFNGVKVRLYVPKGLKPSQNPGIIFYHGGGFCFGGVESHDSVCQLLANGTLAVVVSVEYRLAPVHPYPAGFDDCVAATTYFIQHAEQFGVDPNRVAVAGDSAGGNLAATTSLRLRDINFKPQPKLQVLIYPVLQMMDLDTPSYQMHKDNGLVPSHKGALFFILYATGQSKYRYDLTTNKHTTPEVKRKLGENRLQHNYILQSYSSDGYIKPELDFGDEKIWKELKPVLMDPYFAPLMAKDVSNLPGAIIFTVEQDILRDDGIWYAKYLRDAGVKVTHLHYKAGVHSILSMYLNQKNFVEAREMLYTAINSRL